MPPSRENAQVHLDAAVRAPIVANAQMPRTSESDCEPAAGQWQTRTEEKEAQGSARRASDRLVQQWHGLQRGDLQERLDIGQNKVDWELGD